MSWGRIYCARCGTLMKMSVAQWQLWGQIFHKRYLHCPNCGREWKDRNPRVGDPKLPPSIIN